MTAQINPVDAATSELLEEFRVGGVFVRLSREPTSDDPHRIVYRFADSEAGLDASTAWGASELWQIGNAVSAAGLLGYTHRPGVPIDAEALAERMRRLGAVDLLVPPLWTDPTDDPSCPPAATAWRSPMGRTPAAPIDRRFAIDGLAGRVFTERHGDEWELHTELAPSPFLLGTDSALEVSSLVTLETMTAAAGTLLSIAYEGVTDGERAIAFERLARLGVRLLR